MVRAVFVSKICNFWQDLITFLEVLLEHLQVQFLVEIPEILIKCQDPELNSVLSLVLALVRLDQQVVFLLQQSHSLKLGRSLRPLI